MIELFAFDMSLSSTSLSEAILSSSLVTSSSIVTVTSGLGIDCSQYSLPPHHWYVRIEDGKGIDHLVTGR